MFSLFKKMMMLIVFFSFIGGLRAQTYPDHAIRFIVPYVAGGAGDIFARVVGQKLAEGFGQSVVIDNRPGANGIIGTDLLAKAQGDGYSLVMANSAPFVLNPSLYKTLPYQVAKDFSYITQGTYYAYVLIVHPAIPVKTVQELVDYARTRAVSYGSTGAGSANHLAGEFLSSMNNVPLTHVPYKGSAAALADLLGGQIPMMFDTPITTIPQLKAGKVRALAFTGKRRSLQLSDIPTMEELGYKGFEISSWQGIVAPAGTPKSVVNRIYQESAKVLKMPDVIEKLAKQGGNEIVASQPEAFAKVVQEELVKYAKIIKDAGIRLE